MNNAQMTMMPSDALLAALMCLGPECRPACRSAVLPGDMCLRRRFA